MTEISATSPNEEEQEQEISIRNFMKTLKQFMENMQLMFQKHATASSTTQSSAPHRSRVNEKDSNDASQEENHDRAIHEKTPSASRKRKCVNQVIHNNSQDTVICQRNNSKDPLSKYSRVDSDVEVVKQIKITHTRISLHLSKKTLAHL